MAEGKGLTLSHQVMAAHRCMDTYGCAQHHLDSFNKYLNELLPRIIMESSTVTCETADGSSKQSIRFSTVHMGEPSNIESDGYVRRLSPAEARLRKLTYTAPVHVDVVYSQTANGETKEVLYRNLVLFYQPIMVGSDACYTKGTSATTGGDECPYDCRGYFIINGIEKTILAQERIRTNYPFVFPGKGKYELQSEMRSCHEKRLRSTSTLYVNLQRKVGRYIVTVALPFMSTVVPLGLLYRAIGCVSAEEAISHFPSLAIESEMRKLIHSALEIPKELGGLDQDGAREWIGIHGSTEVTKEKREMYTNHILRNELFPHEGLDACPDTLVRKRQCLSNMVYELLATAEGHRQCDDRDDYRNKRVDTAGWLSSLLLRQLFRPYLKTVQKSLQRSVDMGRAVDVAGVIHPRKITAGLRVAMQSGVWGTGNGSGVKGSQQVGVVQVLNHSSMSAAISSLRRINTPVNKESKTIQPRQLHPSTFGIVCYMETPEGASCGLVRNLAMLAYTRSGYLRNIFDQKLTGGALCDIVHPDWAGSVRILVNGGHAGSTDQPDEVCRRLRLMRTLGELPFDVSIAFLKRDRLRQTAQILLSSDSGCLLRPVFCVAQLTTAAKLIEGGYSDAWARLLRDGCVEFVDKDEEAQYRIASTIEELHNSPAGTFTHLDIHPAASIGLSGISIPFSDHNQAPRNTYQCAMGKQSVGVSFSNWRTRIESVSMTLPSPQKPLVATSFDCMSHGDTLPAGQNVIVAIASYMGFNQEDSLLMNQRSIDLGLMEAIVHRGYRDELSTVNSETQEFKLPDSENGNSATRAIPLVGTRINNGDIVIGKVNHSISNGSAVQQDCSVFAKQSKDYPSTVDIVATSKGAEGQNCVRVRTSSYRRPEPGDKFTSRHGQKGVIGMILSDRDMPFITSGPHRSLKPDIIINPHAIPSRMTIGHLMEGLASKLAVLRGERVDGTPFNGTSASDIAHHLEAHGCERWGNERMINGRTGVPLEAEIMITPVFYQRLKHMVGEKKHSRCRGPTQPTTRQPAEGRSRDGGLRMGEMERDCLLSHGASAVAADRLFEQSDPFVVPLCKHCGSIGESKRPIDSNLRVRARRGFCRVCKTGAYVHDVPMPYACKLFFQEVMALNIKPQLFTTT